MDERDRTMLRWVILAAAGAIALTAPASAGGIAAEPGSGAFFKDCPVCPEMVVAAISQATKAGAGPIGRSSM